MRGTRGQQIGEYAVLLGVVAVAFMSSQMYMSRRVAGGLIAVGSTVLGTPGPPAGTSSATTAFSSVTETGDAGRVRTASTGAANGSSSSGHILAEANGPYVSSVIYYDEDSSRTLELDVDPLADEPDIDGDGEVDLFDRPRKRGSARARTTLIVRDRDGDGILDAIGGFESTDLSDLPDIDGDHIADLGMMGNRGEQAMDGPMAAFFGNDATFALDSDMNGTLDLEPLLTPIDDLDADEVKVASVRAGKTGAEKLKRSKEDARALLLKTFGSEDAVEAAEYLLLDSPETGVILRERDPATGAHISVDKRLEHAVEDITDPDGVLKSYRGDDAIKEVLDAHGVEDLSAEEFEVLLKEVADPGTELHAAFTESNSVVLYGHPPSPDEQIEKLDAAGRVVLARGSDGQWKLGDGVSGALIGRKFSAGTADVNNDTEKLEQEEISAVGKIALGVIGAGMRVVKGAPEIALPVPVGIDRNGDDDADDPDDIQFLHLGGAVPSSDVDPGAMAMVKADGSLSTPQLLVTKVSAEGQISESTGLWDSEARTVNGDTPGEETTEVLLPMATKDGVIAGWAVLGKEGSDSSAGLSPAVFIPDMNRDGRPDETDIAAARANPIRISPKPGDAAQADTAPPDDALMSDVPTASEVLAYGISGQEQTGGQLIFFHRENPNQVPVEDREQVATGIGVSDLVQAVAPVTPHDFVHATPQLAVHQRIQALASAGLDGDQIIELFKVGLGTALSGTEFSVGDRDQAMAPGTGPKPPVSLLKRLGVSQDLLRGILTVSMEREGLGPVDIDRALAELRLDDLGPIGPPGQFGPPLGQP